MGLSELQALDFAAVWAGLSPKRQAAIGTAAIRQYIAANMAEESPAVVTPEDRAAAEIIETDATVDLVNAIEAAMPDTKFHTPRRT